MLSFGPGQTLPLPDDLTGLGITFNSPNYSGGYFDHFHPDVYDITKYNFIRRTYGTEYTEVESTYTFLEVRAGDDINIGHVNGSDSYTGYENKTYNTTSIGGTPYGHAVTGNVPPDTVINFDINTDVAWASGSPPDGTPQIFLTTNGSIVADELTGDMLVGHINSTENDVTLNSGSRILDADSQTTVDVSGVNITLNSGSGLGTLDNASDQARGGIGQADDFLEINVNRLIPTGPLGVGQLDAYDNADEHTIPIPLTIQHDGIFIDELNGDLTVGTVHSIENISLRTVGGSILDAENDDHVGETDATFFADVMGQTIDLDANGTDADIGAIGNVV